MGDHDALARIVDRADRNPHDPGALSAAGLLAAVEHEGYPLDALVEQLRHFQNTVGDVPPIQTQRAQTKVLIADGEIGFTGGMNIGDEYSGRSRRGAAQTFRDSHLEIAGPTVHAFAQVFADDCAFATDTSVETPPSPASPPFVPA